MKSFCANLHVVFLEILKELTHILDRVKKKNKKEGNPAILFFNM